MVGLLDLPTEIRLRIWHFVYRGTALFFWNDLPTDGLGYGSFEEYPCYTCDSEYLVARKAGGSFTKAEACHRPLALPLIGPSTSYETISALCQNVRFFFMGSQAFLAFRDSTGDKNANQIRRIGIIMIPFVKPRYHPNQRSDSHPRWDKREGLCWERCVSKLCGLPGLKTLQLTYSRRQPHIRSKLDLFLRSSTRLSRVATIHIIVAPWLTEEISLHPTHVNLEHVQKTYPQVKFEVAATRTNYISRAYERRLEIEIGDYDGIRVRQDLNQVEEDAALDGVAAMLGEA
ncbi:hypothetical protein BDZ85DRAFT_41018 [Elsinoe ampelina]|uniref:DUF7730 domain-containing protein n=1 Tax=Elsinoe ampelina TaxID=302913 RepID=A0A6A6G225_9PEZI|nr:hypothetical protein BDZ85DRAFT_41018 [Elsinoe ampelina]